MADIWEIARYVEEHPHDFDQRWRLAKKLYMAWEYRLALEHLQILRNEWQPKLNVSRYLAATYYRLGRYDEAIGELENAAERWPEDLSTREQMARVLEIAGRRDDASRVWDAIAYQSPDHPFASAAAKRLRAETKAPTPADLRIQESDSGFNLNPGQICVQCGAQNSYDLSHCWQCNAPLPGAAPSPMGTPRPRLRSIEPAVHDHYSPILGASLAVLAAVALFLTLRLALDSRTLAEAGDIPNTLGGMLSHELLLTRVITGLVVTGLWPLLLAFTIQTIVLRPKKPLVSITTSGLTLGVLAYVCSWLPGYWISLAVILPLLASLVMVIGGFGLSPRDSSTVWPIQAAAMLAIALATFTAVERVQTGHLFNPIRDIPAVVQIRPPELDPEGVVEYRLPVVEIPYEHAFLWSTTDSPWLDYRLGKVAFYAERNADAGPLQFELKEGTRTVEWERLETQEVRLVRRLAPGRHSAGLRRSANDSGPNAISGSIVMRAVLAPQPLP